MGTDNLLSNLYRYENCDATMRVSSNPLILDSAKGSLVTDTSGNEYIDLCAGFGALPLGHNHTSLQRVFKKRTYDLPPINHGLGDLYPSKQKIDLLEALHSVLPEKLSKSTLALSGSQAIEIAIKSAVMKTKKTGFVALKNSYHGLDLGALPLTFRKDFRSPFRQLLKENIEFIEPDKDLQNLDLAIKTLKHRGYEFAACIIEPIQGRAGVVKLSPEWLIQLKDRVHSHNGLFILDEIFTGFGRIGSLTSSYQLNPDITVFGKALGGGMPISICTGTDDVMSSWPCEEEAIHTGTFFGHPLSCEVALNTIKEIKISALDKRSAQLGDQAKSYLKEHLNPKKYRQLRGTGLFIGIQFHEHLAGAKYMHDLRGRGVIALASGNDGDVISITPALNIPEPKLYKALNLIIDTINS